MCLFCDIIEHRQKSYIVYQDSYVTAFLDKFPIKPGHTLVVPNVHSENFLMMDSKTSCQLCNTLKTIAIAVKGALKADGIRLVSNIGESAGQVIFHTHFHIMPAWSQEPDFPSFVPRKEQTEEYYRSIQNIIIDAIKSVLSNSQIHGEVNEST
ncbi:HIT family protein [Sulfuracidifex metallicus]|uniref:HIT family protein n=1 Tax=Sulfuracidifex metallicus TaxID=47303 RepID=UPI002276C968|nr:HIT family protein [Sulfuracidifex metallicus]MCY0849354.1 HIT family protein [Sulfuracidifex metallicus]